jgi:CRISPR-associated endonuclease/helicase Cas3
MITNSNQKAEMKGTPETFWAKLERDENGQVTDWHPLLAHSADVSACFEVLLRESILSRRLAKLVGWQELSECHIARLSVLAAIHDAGKVNHGFQVRKENPRPKVWAGHVSEMISVIEAGAEWQEKLLLALGIEPLIPWFDSNSGQTAFIDMLCATWAHHGRPVRPRTARFEAPFWKEKDGVDPVTGLRALADSVRRWFPTAYETSAPPIPDVPAFRHAFNGVLNLADWLGSNRKFFEYADNLDDRMPFARRRAAELIDSMHLAPRRTRETLGESPVCFEDIADFPPYEVQARCMDLPIDPAGSLTILESDTGSGKTEAAIARFARLYQAGEVDGMYFAVPTRSAAKQLHDRVHQAMVRLFGEHAPPAVLAVPGYIRIDELDGDPQALPGFDVQWPDDEPGAAERGWAAESPRRYLAGAIAVGTVDQVLMSSLQIKYAHLRAAALSRHFLVVDELHSSDAYMHHILQQVVSHHLDAGGHALLMSATLGTHDRVAYSTGGTQAAPPLEEAVEEPYPLITHVDAARKEPRSIAARSSDYHKDVKPTVHPIAADPATIARRALSYAADGARVLIIRNVVKDCLDTQRAIEQLDTSRGELLFGPGQHIAPHHSRFAADDRRRLDEAIEHHFGKEAKGGSVVAVATQTVEQSLDIDADILITDLCPADVLLQRIGRLHRHDERIRPDGFDRARVEVVIPESRDLSEAITSGGDRAGSGLAGKHGLGTVYGDLRVLEATWRQLEGDDLWRIPDDNRRLVEQTTHPATLAAITEELGESWVDHERYVHGKTLGERSHGRLVTIDRTRNYHEAAALEDMELVKTRLGTDDWTVEFEDPALGPFGARVHMLTIPDYWMPQLGEIDDDTLTPEEVDRRDDTLTFVVAGRRFVYDRLGLRPLDED